MGFEPSGVARGASGSTRSEVQALETPHHTFCNHFKTCFKQKTKVCFEMLVLGKKTVKKLLPHQGTSP